MATGIPTATNFMPNAFQQQQYPYRGGVQYNPYSPTHSGAATPTNVSPTQIPHHMGAHTRQLRPPKCPMYVPAALRPTERPQRSSPPKGSDISSPVENTPTRFDRRGTADSFGSTYSEIQRIASDEGSAIGPVTGPPSRNHWKVRYFRFACLVVCIDDSYLRHCPSLHRVGLAGSYSAGDEEFRKTRKSYMEGHKKYIKRLRHIP